ncbi:hypothetical protein RX13_01714 [Escherichia coli]|nr:hypothetical protein RX12_14667 [Escherichia coli]OYB54447.1 hypothetical protein RX15_01715 [Escherichia coli]OYB67140.1 hypothetical protein RX13_01714 [Escherichia coli]OYB86699.1 hypothetical protein RX14_01579 [Escherichia coli]OYB95885.1 hypothetical protein RX16_06211 [Escherichia coli]
MTMLYVKKAMFKHRKKSCEAAILLVRDYAYN